MKPVNFLIGEELRAEADAFAAEKEWSLGKLIRVALTEYLRRRKAGK